jgi:acetylornithine deacetylase/succinyl-diaminopimelate desuccinylase-like protein
VSYQAGQIEKVEMREVELRRDPDGPSLDWLEEWCSHSGLEVVRRDDERGVLVARPVEAKP